MECYETCADRGKKCALSRDKISCFECGKVKPYYNTQSIHCGVCPPTEPCNCPKKDAEKGTTKDTCNCKQTCWEWVLSFLGLGGHLPDCCRNVQLTAWESGESARDALVTKVQDVVSRVSGKEQSPVTTRTSKINQRLETKEAEKKSPDAFVSSEKLTVSHLVGDHSPDQSSGKDPSSQSNVEKKGKTRSSSLQRGRAKHRKKGTSKSRSSSREKHHKRTLSKTRSASSSSTSASQGKKRRSQSRSHSRSSTQIFHPFKGRQCSPPCPCVCTAKSSCTPSPCSPQQLRSFLCRVNEDKVAVYPQKYISPSCHETLLPCTASKPVHIRRSNSMSYKPYTNNPRPPAMASCKCVAECFNGRPQVPFRSQSCNTTTTKNPSPQCGCLSTQTKRAPLTLGRRASSCVCSFECSAKRAMAYSSSCYCPSKPHSIFTPCCKEYCMGQRPPLICRSVCKPQSRVGTSCCSSTCCQTLERRNNIFPQKQYLSPPSCNKNPPCLCSPGGTCRCCCCCPKHTTTSMNRPTCRPASVCRLTCSPTSALNYIKAKQNDVICQQLLARYGYSPPALRPCPNSCYPCPNSCYGHCSEGICTVTSCTPSYARCPGIGGCRVCRPCAGQHNVPPTCEGTENYTNSRKPGSPGGQACHQQIIELKSSPCQRRSRGEFQLPPHCIRKTGPRSPVGEYLTILRVPKQIPRQEHVDTAVETVGDAGVKASEIKAAVAEDIAKETTEKSEAIKAGKKKTTKHSKKKTKKSSDERNVNISANNACTKNNRHVSNIDSLYIGKRAAHLDQLYLSNNAANLDQLYIAKKDSPRSEHILLSCAVVTDCSPPGNEESSNNNYGGDSYRTSRYSSAGPVQIDFSELNSHSNRYTNRMSWNSVSSGYVSRYPRHAYCTTSNNFDVGGSSNCVPQLYKSDTREFREPCSFVASWYTGNTVSNVNINAQKQHADVRPSNYNRSFNSIYPDIPDSVKSTRCHVQLETAIDNKIKELRESKTFQLPQDRKRNFSYLGSKSHMPYTPVSRDGADSLQQEFIRESWDQLNQRAEKRRKELLSSQPCSLNNTSFMSALTKQSENKQQQYTDNSDNRCQKTEDLPNQSQQKKQTTQMWRETKPHIESSKQKADCLQRSRTPCLETESKCNSVENKQMEVLPRLGASRAFHERTPSKVECIPVYHSLLESFEGTVQSLVRSKTHDCSTLVGTTKTKEVRDASKVNVDDTQEDIHSDESSVNDWNEENQSSNKLDKTNMRAKVCHSSPPHKPMLFKSPDIHNSGGSVATCSCHSNSPGTSSVSLEMSHCVHSAESSPSISGSASGDDTSLTFTKLSDTSRPCEHPTQEQFNHFINQTSASTVLSNNLTESVHYVQDTKTKRMASSPQSQPGSCGDHVTVLSAPTFSGLTRDDDGSSVDPLRISVPGNKHDMNHVYNTLKHNSHLEHTHNNKIEFMKALKATADCSPIRQIATPDCSPLRQIATPDCSRSGLTTPDCSPHRQIATPDCSRSGLTTPDCSPHRQIATPDCSRSELTTPDEKSLTTLLDVSRLNGSPDENRHIATPYENKLTLTPDISRLKTTPNGSRLTATPYGIRINATPNVSRSRLTTTPDISRLTVTSHVSKLHATPDVSRFTSTPDVSRLKTTSNVSKINATPDGSRLTATPNVSRLKYTSEMSKLKSVSDSNRLKDSPDSIELIKRLDSEGRSCSDVSQCFGSPKPVLSMNEILREFIRRNGTPV